MYSLFSAFFFSLIGTLLIIRYQSIHSSFTGDLDISGPQKFHSGPIPRIGGLSIFLAVVLGSFIRLSQAHESGIFLLVLVLCVSPAFLVGLAEDISKKMGIALRLLVTSISAALIGYTFQAWISKLDIWGLDSLITITPPLSIFITILALSGLSNAYNIIDGFNGLASMVGIIALLGISYVCFRVNDIELLIAGLVMIGAISGFFIWNYPRGLIFLGDGGAYLIGMWVGSLSILLVSRNPTVSPWFALLINAYPIFETLFSIWRRKVHQGKNPGMPDGAHFHTLIYRRVMRWAIPNSSSKNKFPNNQVFGNAKTSPYLWILSSFATFPAVLAWQHTWILQASFVVFCLSYIWLYKSIVRFQTPKWIN